MQKLGRKTVYFPCNEKSYMDLAKRKARIGDCSNAIDYCYRAQSVSHDDEHYLFIARMLTQAEEYERSLRMLFTHFNKPEERSIDVLNAMRDNYRCMHEYMHERIMLQCISNRGGTLLDSEPNAEVAAELLKQEMVLNDTLTYGSDLSSLDSSVCANKQIMLVSAALQTQRDFLRFDMGKLKRTYEVCADQADYDTPLPLAESILFDCHSLYVISCMFSNEVEKASKHIEKLQRIRFCSANNLAVICAYSMLINDMPNRADEIERIGSSASASYVDKLCACRSYMMLAEYKKAVKYAKAVLQFKPYSVDAIHMLGICSYNTGDFDNAYACYEKISKMLPDDLSAQYYKKLCKKAKDEAAASDDSETVKLPDGYAVDMKAARLYIEDMRSIINTPIDELDKKLDTDKNVINLFANFINVLEEKTQKNIVDKLCCCEGKGALSLLRIILLDSDIVYAAKNSIAEYFKDVYPDEQVAICCGRAFFESYTRQLTKTEMGELFDVYKRCYKMVMREYGAACAVAVNEIFLYLLPMSFEASLDRSTLLSLAPCVQMLAARMCGFDVELYDATEFYLDVDADEAEEAIDLICSIEEDYINDLFSNL